MPKQTHNLFCPQPIAGLFSNYLAGANKNSAWRAEQHLTEQLTMRWCVINGYLANVIS